MARKFTTGEEYAQFYARVEGAFTPEQMSRESLVDWLNNESLADLFALTREIALQIKKAETIEELRELQNEAMNLTIHKQTLLDRIDNKVEEIRIQEKERQIAESIARVEQFAQAKKIKLTEKVIGREESWRGKPVLVIRGEKGRFKAWKRL